MNRSSLALCASHAPGMNLPGNETTGPAFRRGIVESAQLVKAFDPELVVMFGADHRRAFREIIPTFLSVWEARGLGDYGSPVGAFAIPQDLVGALTKSLVASDFDIAVGTSLVLDHGFTQTAHQVLGGLDAYPIVPIFINCATAPLPSTQRVVTLGAQIGQFMNTTDRRVLYLASGGLSHTPPTLDANTRLITDERRKELLAQNADTSREMVYPDWDAIFLKALSGPGETVLDVVTDEFVLAGGTGAHEVRNWLAAWAAAGRQPLDTIAYESVPEWFTGMGIAASRHADPSTLPPTYKEES